MDFRPIFQAFLAKCADNISYSDIFMAFKIITTVINHTVCNTQSRQDKCLIRLKSLELEQGAMELIVSFFYKAKHYVWLQSYDGM